MPEQTWDAEQRETARRIRSTTGKDVVYVTGRIEVRGTGGQTAYVRGVNMADRIILQSDNMRVSVRQLAEHEIYHEQVQNTPGLNRRAERAIRAQYGAEEYQAVVDRYVRALRGLYDLTSYQTAEENLLRIKEEIFADAYAGINYYQAGADQFQEPVRSVTPDATAQTAAATDRTTGPPTTRQTFSRDDDSGLRLPGAEESTAVNTDPDDHTPAEQARQEEQRFSADDDSGLRLPGDETETREQERAATGNVTAVSAQAETRTRTQEPPAPAKNPQTRTRPKPVAESRPSISKRDLRQNMLNLFSIPEGRRSELGTMIDNYADRLIKNGELTQNDRDALFDRLYAEGVMQVQADEAAQMGRQAVVGSRIYVNKQIRADLGDNWQELRRRAFAAGVQLVNDTREAGPDVLNADLAQTLPWLFDENETDGAAMLERIVQVAEEGRDQKMSLAEYAAVLSGQEHISEDEILDNMERQLDWALRTYRVTRTRAKSGKATLNIAELVDGEEWTDRSKEKSRDTQQEIINILGIDSLTLKACALIMQDQYGLFLQADKEARMSILGSILGLGIYEDMEELAADRATDTNRTIRFLAARADTILAGLPDSAELATQIEDAEARRKGLDQAAQDKAAAVDCLKVKLNTQLEAAGRVLKLNSKLSTLTATRATKEQLKTTQVGLITAADTILAAEPEIMAGVAEYN